MYAGPAEYCLGNRTCAKGRKAFNVNPLCGECEDETFTEWSNVCVKCEQTDGRFLLLCIVLSWLYVLVMLRSAQRATGLVKIFRERSVLPSACRLRGCCVF